MCEIGVGNLANHLESWHGYDKHYAETTLTVRLINTTNEKYSRTRGQETTPLRVQDDMDDVCSELDN
ncbi:hypothetical protein TNCV_2792141 [Trichonephila clavipes]|nr:hypothetical protein TNCV_2792141 [Trichonephila clavipes]